MQIYEHEAITAVENITCVITWERHRVISSHMQDICRLKDQSGEMLLGTAGCSPQGNTTLCVLPWVGSSDEGVFLNM